MSNHRFQLRLSCQYQDPDNSIAGLEVEVLTADGWQVLDLNTGSPGFLLFVYTVFHCQHTYMRVNCAERGLSLASASGTIEVVASAEWVVQTLHIDFSGHLKSGEPSATDIDDIVDRMRHCPVSMNLKPVADSRTSLTLD